MQQMHPGRTQAGPGDRAPLPALQSIEQARPTLLSGGPSREAPRGPRAPHICGRCETKEVHICLHSAAQSVRSDGSIGSQRQAEPPDPAGAAPRLSPAFPRQPSRIGQWVEDSEPGRETPASPLAAAEEAPLHYAGSVASTAGHFE